MVNAARRRGGNAQAVVANAYERACEWVADCGGDVREWFVYEVRCVTDFDGADRETCDWLAQQLQEM
ncbi:hypothetical protein BcepSauron_009 [Burkholderia phage BcepSauron]|uniref:Uncharacterized protein n=1 Tax=Burkholderia phage BcepSauron TaxID=2530033 RepID=A0A482ML63_9CAUD|nr:hypothetical protein H1O17_gp009 [Burkholderia phage BcepSauron]QBQ74389.1 hypothetical protein BcepSauron_009 [Burkholderia phage BcepSauron]